MEAKKTVMGTPAYVALRIVAGKGGGTQYIPAPPSPPPPPDLPDDVKIPEPSKAELELEEMKSNQRKRLASLRGGRKSTFLVGATESQTAETSSGGLLSYDNSQEDMGSNTLG